MANEALITIRALDKTAKGFSSVGKKLRDLGNKAAKMGAALAAAGTVGFAALVKSGLAAGDSLAKTADKIGATTEALAQLRYAAELSGVSTQTMDMALQRMTRRVSEAANGTGEAVGALAELGINAKELEQLPLDVQMATVADAMQNVGSQSDRVRLAMKLFDSEGVALVNTLKGGSAALAQTALEADKLGLSLSRVETAQIEAANDSFTRLSKVSEGLKNQLAVAFAPILEAISASFYQSALDSAEFGNTGQRVADALVRGFARLRGVMHNLELFVKIVQLSFMKLGNYIATKLAPIIDGFIGIYNKIAALLGKPLVESGMQQFLEESTAGIQELQKEIGILGEQDPAQGILDAYERIKVASRETAEVVAENAPGTILARDAEEGAERETAAQEYKKEGARNLAQFEAKNATDKTRQVTSELGKQFGAWKGQSKKMFAISKAMNIATAIMDTYKGANVALGSYPPPLNYVMAAGVIAGGLANVAQIRSQSFEGGGFTGHGARTGGVDGKGGFPAILHPNETVIDHTKSNGRMQSGGQAVVVNQTINISTGVAQTVRAEMVNLMPQIANAAKSAVADARQRGGSYSQAIIGA